MTTHFSYILICIAGLIFSGCRQCRELDLQYPFLTATDSISHVMNNGNVTLNSSDSSIKELRFISPEAYLKIINEERVEFRKNIIVGAELVITYIPPEERALKSARKENKYDEGLFLEFLQRAENEMTFQVTILDPDLLFSEQMASSNPIVHQTYGIKNSLVQYFAFSLDRNIKLTQANNYSDLVFYYPLAKNKSEEAYSCVVSFDISKRENLFNGPDFILEIDFGVKTEQITISKYLPELITKINFKK